MNEDIFQDIPLLRLERCDHQKCGLRLSVYLAPENLRDGARRLLEKEYFLEDVSVVEVAEGFVGVYHFDHFAVPGRVALRVLTEREAPELPSIADIYDGAAWHERESRDFFGVSFAGNDNPLPLLLPGDATFHPLRKEDKALKSWTELIEPGDVIQEDPNFTLFAPAAEEGTEGEATEGEAAEEGAAPEKSPSPAETEQKT